MNRLVRHGRFRIPCGTRIAAALAVLAISALPFSSSIANPVHDSSVLSSTDAFVLQNLSQSYDSKSKTTNVSLDVYVKGYANAVLEVYDKNGNLSAVHTVQGKRPSTSILSDMADKQLGLIGSLLGQGDYKYKDIRNPAVSEKTLVDFRLPLGGYFVVTKSGTNAMAANVAEVLIEILGQIKVPGAILEDTEFFVEPLISAIAKSPVVNLINVSANKKVDNKELMKQGLDLCVSIIQSYAQSKAGSTATRLAEQGIKNIGVALAEKGSIWGYAELIAASAGIAGIALDMGAYSAATNIRIEDDGFDPYKTAPSIAQAIAVTVSSNEMVLSNRQNLDQTIKVGELNNDTKLQAIRDAESITPVGGSFWSGNFVLNYSWNGGGFGYGDGEFTTTNTKPAPGGDATLTYYHLGERHYQVEIGDIELDELGNYNYTVWGDWRKADSKLAQFEADYAHCSSCTSELTPWVAVQRMRPDDIQRLSGSATYRGELSSVMIGESGGSAFQQGSGSILMTANFGNDHLSGALIVRRQSDVWATATFATELERDAGLQFDSTLSGTNISNAQNWHSQIRGEFGGPQANEAGGMWAITKTDGSQATGTFHAKKQ